MIIGVPKEIKNNEYRIAIIPAYVEILVKSGHSVLIEKGAGKGSGISDEEFKDKGADIIASKRDLFRNAEIIYKVKEPLPEEYDLFNENQILYTFLHLATAPQLASKLLEKGLISIAYETIELLDGTLPLLTPMSEVAGKMAIQIGAMYLQN